MSFNECARIIAELETAPDTLIVPRLIIQFELMIQACWENRCTNEGCVHLEYINKEIIMQAFALYKPIATPTNIRVSDSIINLVAHCMHRCNKALYGEFINKDYQKIHNILLYSFTVYYIWTVIEKNKHTREYANLTIYDDDARNDDDDDGSYDSDDTRGSGPVDTDSLENLADEITYMSMTRDV